MLAAALCFALMAAFTKLGAADFDTFELVFYRSLFGVVLIGIWAVIKGFSIRTALFFSHMKRSFLGTLALSIWFFAIANLPLGTAMTLNYTNPLYMALLLTVIAIKKNETIEFGLIGTIIAGFAGITLVLRPELRSGDELPALIGLSAGFFTALAYFQVKQLCAMKEPEWRIVFYFTLFGAVWGLGGQILTTGLHPLTAENVPALLGMGISATVAQLCMTRAWGAGNIFLTSVLQFSAIVFAVLLGRLFFDEPISLQSSFGIVIIIGAGVAATLLTKRKRSVKSA